MGTLALMMFVIFAVLSNSHGKDAGNGGSASVGIAKGEVIIGENHGVSKIVSDPVGQTISAHLTLWQFVSMIVNALAGAFNDPSLTDYGKQQGIDVSDSLTAPCPSTSQQRSTLSKGL